MEQWLKYFENPEGLSIALLAAAFVLGLLATATSCCNFAILGAVAGYSGTLDIQQNKRKLLLINLSFFLGIFLSFIAIGLITGFAGQQIADNIGPYWKIFAGCISILAGLLSMGLIKIKSPAINLNKSNTQKSFLASMLFGLTIGGASTVCTACCSPVFPVIIGASFLQHDYFRGIIVVFLFSIGYSLPYLALLTGLGLSFDKVNKHLNKMSVYIKYITGAILIIVGFYFLITF